MRTIFLLMALILGWSGAGVAQQPTVEECLIRVEEGQKALVQRIDDTNRRIDDLRTDLNQRFGDLRFYFQAIAGILALVVGGLIALCFVIWCRLVRLDAQFDHFRAMEKDRMLAFQRAKIEPLQVRIERLEAAGKAR